MDAPRQPPAPKPPGVPLTDRRMFLRLCAAAGLPPMVGERLAQGVAEAGLPDLMGDHAPQQTAGGVTRATVKAAEGMLGLQFTDTERDQMLGLVEHHLASFALTRNLRIPYQVPPAVQFTPVLAGRTFVGSTSRPAPPRPRGSVRRPASDAELAYLPVTELAELIRTRRVSSVVLTRLYLARLKRYNPALHCVVSLTEERALRQAVEADREIAAGRYRGALHGVPYGVKDTLAVRDYPTTWGAVVHKDRVLSETATVVERLDRAGAVLLAKLSMGELGLSEIWYGGRIMSPWGANRGAGGSSGGSAVATAAGLAAFGIGTETLGSIVTPATRNGVTGLRPTFGRVSRHGAMSLCWSLDKIGPLARSVEDCALILEAIAGPDGRDPTVTRVPYGWDPGRRLSSVRVGYFKTAFDADRPGKARDAAALEALRSLGVKPIEVDLPTDLPVTALRLVMVEAAAAFDEMTRGNKDDLLVEQGADDWPNFFRAARFIPAVEYLQANRIRTMLMERLDAVFRKVDVFMAPTFGVVLATNLTGHPCVVVPNGFGGDNAPASISFIGQLYAESELCTVARAWQEATGWHQRHPAGFAQ